MSETITSPPTADYVLDLLREYEDTHDSIADRLLGRLIGADPARALVHLELAKRHLDERMLRSVVANMPPVHGPRRMLRPDEMTADRVLVVDTTAGVSEVIPSDPEARS